MDKLNNISKFIAATLGEGGRDNDDDDNINFDNLAASFTNTTGGLVKELDEDCVYDPTSYINDDDDILLKEYGYKYDDNNDNDDRIEGAHTTTNNNNNKDEEDEDEDDDIDPLTKIEKSKDLQRLLPIHKPTAVITTKRKEKIPYVFVLGQTYHPITQYHERKQYESSLFWFTYRHNFPEIRPYGITTDAGWGCMLRSAQMLLAHTLRVHFQSKFWKPSKSLSKTRSDDAFTLSLMRWFADFPSKAESIYSLHNMVAAGLSKYETLPGEWYGPNKVSYVLRDLVELHSKTQPSLFRVHVCSEGTIYKDQIHTLMTRDSKRRAEERQQQRSQHQPAVAVTQPSHPLEDPFVGAAAATTTTTTAQQQISSQNSSLQQQQQPKIQIENLEWDTSLLLLIPLRLGLDKFNEDYTLNLARSFWLPQSVGVLGGRPRGARWFFGSYADGSRVLGLDPHTIQAAPKKKMIRRTNNNACVWEIDMTDNYLRSVHTPYPETYQILKMDPSIAIGYYCRTKKEFLELEKSFQEIKDANPELPDLFTFVDVAPDYSSTSFGGGGNAALAGGDSSILSDTTPTDHHDDDDLLGGVGGKIEESDDEDEYVLL